MSDQVRIPPNFLKVGRKSFYEISWKIRRQVAVDFLAANPNATLQDVLDILEDFENRHLCRLEIVSSSKDSAIGETFFYTGKVDVKRTTDGGCDVGALRSRSYAGKIVEIVRAFAYGPFDLVVELGAGYGINLFRLGDAEISAKQMVAAEITESGQEFCQFLSGLAPNFDVATVTFDHRRPDLSFAEGAQSILLLSCHSIEQVENIPETFFQQLSMTAPRVAGIHFEPFGFQTDIITENTDRHRFFINERGFNENFYACLRASENEGVLHVRQIEVEIFDHQSENPTSLAVWDNAGWA